MADQAHFVDGGPVTPKARRSSGTSVITNPYRGDQGRYPAAPYVTYAETSQKSQNSGVEEIDNSCVVYVGGLTNIIDDRILYDTFRQFGSIVSLVRRSVNFDVRPNSTMTQYAFIGFSNSQDAQNAIQTGELTIDNRKLIIKPRDKPGVSYHKHISHGFHNPRAYNGFKEKHGGESKGQILQLLQKNTSGSQPVPQSPVPYEDHQQQHMQQAQQQQHHEHRAQQRIQNDQQVPAQSPLGGREPITYYDGSISGPAGAKTSNTGQSPVLMSKALNVANVPIDMSPKELFTIFSEVGLVEGCYIFPFADPMNRRFGHIVMSTFYCAQKACEIYDGYTIRGCTLDVTYRNHAESDTNPTSSPPVPYNASYQPMQQPMQQPYPQPFQQFQQPSFPTPMYHPAFQAQHQQVTWLPQPYGSTSGIVGPPGMIPFAHQFPQYQNIIPFAAYNPMSPMSPLSFEAQHHNSASPTNSPPYRSFPVPSSAWQGEIQVTNKPYQIGRPVHRRQNGRVNGRYFLSNRSSTHFPDSEPHLRSVSDSSSTTLVSSGYEHAKYDGPVIVNGSFTGSPVIVNGSYAGSSETPSRNSINEDTSESDKDSTPSPAATRSAPDSHLTPETPTKVSRATFEVLTASIIPETTEPADPANLYIKNLDDAVISSVEELKELFLPYGPVASSFLSTYPGSGISRGYGFVAFVKQEDAAAAKTKLNGTMVGKKRVFISYAERKEDRTQRLKGLFGGDKGDSKKEKKEKIRRDKVAGEIQEGFSDDEALGTISVDGQTMNDERVVAATVVTDAPLPREISVAEVEDSVESIVEPYVKEAAETAETPGNDTPSATAEQEIAVTARWRGTQLTKIAEVVEEDDLSRTSPLLSTNLSYVLPSIAHSPTHTPRESFDSPPVLQTTPIKSPMILEQQNSPVPSLGEYFLDIANNGNQQSRDSISSSRQGRQLGQQQCANHSPNNSSDDQRDTRGGYGQRQHQGYYQGNGNGRGSTRPFYRNNHTGSYSNTKSMLPVPRGSNGTAQITPGFIAPNGPRMPCFNSGTQQQFYPSYPNNEPIGQNYQSKKNNRKNFIKGRARDNNPSTHQARVQNTLVNGRIGKVEMTASAF